MLKKTQPKLRDNTWKNILIRSSIAYIHIWIWTDVVFTFYCYVHNYRYEYCIGIKIMISANLDRWSHLNR